MNIDRIVSSNQANHCFITLHRSTAQSVANFTGPQSQITLRTLYHKLEDSAFSGIYSGEITDSKGLGGCKNCMGDCVQVQTAHAATSPRRNMQVSRTHEAGSRGNEKLSIAHDNLVPSRSCLVRSVSPASPRLGVA